MGRIEVLEDKVKVLDQGLTRLVDKQTELSRQLKESSLLLNGKIDSMSPTLEVLLQGQRDLLKGGRQASSRNKPGAGGAGKNQYQVS